MADRNPPQPKSRLGTFNETVATVNSAVRTLLATVLVGGLGYGGYLGYQQYNAKDITAAQARREAEDALKERDEARKGLDAANLQLVAKDERIGALNRDLELKQEQIDRLEVSMSLLKVDKRLARLTAVDQGTDSATNEKFTDVEFVELNAEGKPLGEPRKFRIKGDMVYLDSWLVKFDDKYTQDADLERGVSLVLFRRIFGEKQQPSEGFPLDETNSRPQAYARGQETELEKKIWGDFWGIANDEAKAKELGIRAAHGEAVYIRMQKGKSYKVQLRASDGLSVVPEKPDGA